MCHYEALRRFIRPLRRSFKRFWGSLRSTRGSNSGVGGPILVKVMQVIEDMPRVLERVLKVLGETQTVLEKHQRSLVRIKRSLRNTRGL